MSDPGGLSQILGVWKQTKRNDRDINHHQKNGDRIVIARIRIALHAFQRALQSSKLIKRARQQDEDVLVDELAGKQVAYRVILPMKNESLLVAPMGKDLLQLGIGQICLQLVLEAGLAFRSRKSGKISGVATLRGILPGLAFAQEIAQRGQPGEMAIKYILQSGEGLRGIQSADRRRQPVGQDEAVGDELAGRRKRFIESRVALLILECEDDRQRRSYDGQDRRRYRQKIPVRDLKERGDEHRP